MIKMDSVHDPNGTYPAARILAAARCRSRTRTVIKMESVRDANESHPAARILLAYVIQWISKMPDFIFR